ncbi:MAG: hypothetical protein UY44_C0006G0001 [Candidatus Kaiserbacteria bacterium GW2011_GWA2_49_19]|uniref:Uncharacterized protein n=1 Tax=Candidatus Kaiserbacteria bacterium GW2011_GWA2_49_19 TaxID=1618669 RepID=A0A0G1VR28_9BACT|nr:MAG: hypothetical protein UY44_C0006G0001 [Candidatus Kaiserbacteria bacterium GW2011_GWA2_49_19]
MIALAMTVVLFIYGYLLSTAGHDHSKHSPKAHIEVESGHEHAGHTH